MKITGIIWLDSVVEIEAKHGVSRGEVYQVIQSRAMFRFVEDGHRRGENVYAALGQTEAGRYLTVFFIHKPDHRILIVTARDEPRGKNSMTGSNDRKRVARRKSTVSKAKTYSEMGDFWDEHDLSDYWGSTRSVRAEVSMESEESLYAIERGLSDTIRREAKERASPLTPSSTSGFRRRCRSSSPAPGMDNRGKWEKSSLEMLTRHESRPARQFPDRRIGMKPATVHHCVGRKSMVVPMCPTTNQALASDCTQRGHSSASMKSLFFSRSISPRNHWICPSMSCLCFKRSAVSRSGKTDSRYSTRF